MGRGWTQLTKPLETRPPNSEQSVQSKGAAQQFVEPWPLRMANKGSAKRDLARTRQFSETVKALQPTRFHFASFVLSVTSISVALPKVRLEPRPTPYFYLFGSGVYWRLARKMRISKTIANRIAPNRNQGNPTKAKAYPPIFNPFTHSVMSRPKTKHSITSRSRGLWQFPRFFSHKPSSTDDTRPSGTHSQTVIKVIQSLTRLEVTSQVATAPHSNGRVNASSSTVHRF